MQQENNHKSISKLYFILGLAVGIAVISLVGIVFLLAKGGGLKNKAESGDSNAIVKDSADDAPREITLSDITEDDHIRGSIDAPVKIVEYSDLECPFCKRHHSTMKQIMEEYGDKVAWVYRHFPLVSLHSKAPKEAEATECASELGGNDGFWAMTDKIFEATPSNNGLDLESLPDLAAEIGLDKDKFKECLDSGKYSKKIQAQYQDAVSAGGQGTPYNIIIGPNGDKVPLAGAYPFESFKQVIDALLEG